METNATTMELWQALMRDCQATGMRLSYDLRGDHRIRICLTDGSVADFYGESWAEVVKKAAEFVGGDVNEIPVENLSDQELLETFDAMTQAERFAWLGFFSGARNRVTKFEDRLRVSFGKSECEQVDFETVWMGKFVDLGWLRVVEVRRYRALGLAGEPEAIEYLIVVKHKGLRVYEAYCDRFAARADQAARELES